MATIVMMTACLAAGAAGAQNLQNVVTLGWERQPDGMDYARNYPRAARDRDISGAAVLCCTINPDRTFNCTAPFEWPAGYGFGEATVRISREFRITEESYAQTRATPNGYIRRMIRWVMAPSTPELEDVYRRISEGTQNICEGPATPVS